MKVRDWIIVCVGVCALLRVGAVCAIDEPSAPPASEQRPTLFLIDSANTLRAYDDGGKAVASITVKSSIGSLNGGLTLAMNRIYVTWARKAGDHAVPWVTAFNAQRLNQTALHVGAFTVTKDSPDPGLYLDMVFDPDNKQFYVASEHGGLLMFNGAGVSVSMPSASQTQVQTRARSAPVSSLSYSADERAIVGLLDNRRVVKFNADDGSISAIWPEKGEPYRHGRRLLAISACGAKLARTASVVGDSQPEAAPPESVGQRYALLAAKLGDGKRPTRAAGFVVDAMGGVLAKLSGPPIAGAHAISCGERGEIFVATDTGVRVFDAQGHPEALQGDLAEFTSPVLGILVIE